MGGRSHPRRDGVDVHVHSHMHMFNVSLSGRERMIFIWKADSDRVVKTHLGLEVWEEISLDKECWGLGGEC